MSIHHLLAWYYMATTLFTLWVCLKVHPDRSVIDHVMGSLIVSAALGWLVWPLMLYGVASKRIKL